MTERACHVARRVREESCATGDPARQVNHDAKNGLFQIRNVAISPGRREGHYAACFD
jgi:hypothetical protein